MIRKSSQKSVGDNVTFVRLIQVAKEEKEIRDKIISICSLDSFHRQSMIKTLIEDMRLKGAPKDFMEAIASLSDDGVAQEVLRVLNVNG